MFVRILSLIRLARVSRLVRFFNEVEKVSAIGRQSSKLTSETQSTFLLGADTFTRPGSNDKSDFGHSQCHL